MIESYYLNIYRYSYCLNITERGEVSFYQLQILGNPTIELHFPLNDCKGNQSTQEKLHPSYKGASSSSFLPLTVSILDSLHRASDVL